MQLSIYISEILDLNNLNAVESRLEKINQENKVTGVTSYSGGYCLQVIEGLECDLKGSICDIFMNDSLQNHSEILNVDTQKRFFSDCSLSIVSSLHKDDAFKALTKFLNNNVELLSQSQKKLMSVFHNIEERKIPSPEQANPFNPLVYSISEWPDFKQTQPSYNLISLCNYLIKKPSCFRTLVSQHIFGLEEQIRLSLQQLNKSGYLQVAQQKSASSHTCEFHNSSLQQVVKIDEPVVDEEEIIRITQQPLTQASKRIAAN